MLLRAVRRLACGRIVIPRICLQIYIYIYTYILMLYFYILYLLNACLSTPGLRSYSHCATHRAASGPLRHQPRLLRHKRVSLCLGNVRAVRLLACGRIVIPHICQHTYIYICTYMKYIYGLSEDAIGVKQ